MKSTLSREIIFFCSQDSPIRPLKLIVPTDFTHLRDLEHEVIVEFHAVVIFSDVRNYVIRSSDYSCR